VSAIQKERERKNKKEQKQKRLVPICSGVSAFSTFFSSFTSGMKDAV
jgi:hypothetical protein